MANLFGSIFDKNYEIEVDPFDLRVVIVETDGKFMARCVDFELVGEGKEKEKAVEDLMSKVLTKIQHEWEHKLEPMSSVEHSSKDVVEWSQALPAESKYWMTVWKLKPNQDNKAADYKLWN